MRLTQPRLAQPRPVPIGVTMPRHIFVVSRHHPELYEYLTKRFQQDTNVRVIFDRRRAERRQSPGTGPPREGERRWRLERRVRTSVDDELKTRSHTIIKIGRA